MHGSATTPAYYAEQSTAGTKYYFAKATSLTLVRSSGNYPASNSTFIAPTPYTSYNDAKNASYSDFSSKSKGDTAPSKYSYSFGFVSPTYYASKTEYDTYYQYDGYYYNYTTGCGKEDGELTEY